MGDRLGIRSAEFIFLLKLKMHSHLQHLIPLFSGCKNYNGSPMFLFGANLYRTCSTLGADGCHWWTLLLRFDYVHIWR